ncbi:immunoglobulin superfamily member 6 isoform X2 [Echinops telfairi]|uniref:immunoglobulin superfamily member 6 isoform X2 n=1 Tax=Echinops telfairi TaxID=9371 RepID=UPI001E1DAA01|nr:immunoglobulin superfamily member 6 isoform X2 [Echinops telfairi]
MEAVNRGKLALGLEINLILLSFGAAGACTVSVTQPSYLHVEYTQQAVTITCTFSSTRCPPELPTSLWFRYDAQRSERLCSDGCQSQADKFTVREFPAQNQVSLTVNWVTQNDSAIYICGIAFPSASEPKAKQTGGGTTLVVRERELSAQLQNSLIALLLLFSVYLVAVGVVFVVLSRSKSNSLRNKDIEEDSQKKKSARRIFQDIAQELYHKRYVERSQQEKDSNTYENRRAVSNCERP